MMKKLKALVSALAITSAAFAQTQYIHIYEPDGNVRSIEQKRIDLIEYDKDGNSTIKYSDGTTEKNAFDSITHWTSGADVPVVRIDTDEYVEEIPDKENYLKATITVNGRGVVPDFSGAVNVRGRGNSTWYDPKKPYRLKFDKKTGLGGLAKAKSFVLLANWIDPSGLRNAIAMKAGELLGIPYANTIVPVDVYFNGDFKGAYMLTEKIGMTSASVDIDEDESVLFEIDDYFDEDWRFESKKLHLPAMIKDPDMTDELFEYWKDDFNHMDQVVYNAFNGEDADVWSEIDLPSAVRYIMVYNLTMNHEVKYPKSVYLHKTKGGKYRLGPLWDFDYAFGHRVNEQQPLLVEQEFYAGYRFFISLVRTPEFMAEYARVWDEFKLKLPELFEFIDEYSRRINPSGHRDVSRWPSREYVKPIEHDEAVEQTKKWLHDRIEFISDPLANFSLYQ